MAAAHKLGELDARACRARRTDGRCVLTRDLVLHATIAPGSFTEIDCAHHTLRPASPGTDDDPATDENEFVASVPHTGFLLDRVREVSIRNCHLEGFDFGIAVVDSKRSERLGDNAIVDSKIDARAKGVFLLRADGTVVRGNRIWWRLGGGIGVKLLHDSDDNSIVDNRLISPGTDSGFVPLLPGGIREDDGRDIGVHLSTTPRFRDPVIDFTIGGQLRQYAAVERAGNGWIAVGFDRNRIDGNVIVGGEREPSTIAVFLDGAGRDNQVRGNQAVRSFVFIAGGTPVPAPGWCALNPGHLCGDHDACAAAELGDCVGAGATFLDTTLLDPRVDGNHIIGPTLGFGAVPILAVANVDGLRIEDNLLEGDGTPNPAIFLGGSSSASAIITGNIVKGGHYSALMLSRKHGGEENANFNFGSRVWDNDFLDTEIPVVLDERPDENRPRGLPFPGEIELSFNGRGNFWGHSCARGGFLAATGPFVCAHDGAVAVACEPSDASACFAGDAACVEDPDTRVKTCEGEAGAACSSDADCPIHEPCWGSFTADTPHITVVDSHPFGRRVARRGGSPCW